MALTNYTDLQSSIASWLHRSDLTAIIPDFITLAESRINRTLRVNPKMIDTPLTATIGSRYIALPAGFIEAEGLWLEYYAPRRKLPYVTPTELVVGTGNGNPSYWTIDGANIALDWAADIAYSFTLRNYQSFALSSGSPTNWLLTNHPDVYLYAALVESAPYIKDDARIELWKGLYSTAVVEVQDKESRTDSLSTLPMDGAMLKTSGASQIFTG